MARMKHLALIACLVAIPALAQNALAQNAPAESPGEAPPGSEGLDLMQEGAELLFRGLIDEMAPALESLQDLGEQVGPVLDQLTAEMAAGLATVMAKIDDLTYYEMPEILPNGDIIIRRSPDAPPYEPPPPEEPAGPFDL